MYRLGNFTIILSNYNCDRNCPFCIAKNNRKFNGEDKNFENLNELLVLLRRNKIKFDIALTRILETDTLPSVLDELLFNNTNIGLIRFKNLMSGENDESTQAKWVRDNRMSKEAFLNLSKNIMKYYKCESFDNLRAKNGTKIVFENSGNYPKDIVYNNGTMKDYTEKVIDIPILRKMSIALDSARELDYNYTR